MFNKTRCFSFLIIILTAQLYIFSQGFSRAQEADIAGGNTVYPGGQQEEPAVQAEAPEHIVRKKYFSDGKVQIQASYLAGALDGSYLEYHENGQVALEMSFRQGREQGPYRRYYSDGTIQESGQYENGEVQGPVKQFYQNGNIEKIVMFRDQQVDGLVKVFYPNGQVQEETNYARSVPEGISRSFYENGQVKDELLYKDGKRQGPFREWDEEGNIKMSGIFRDDELDSLVVLYRKNGMMQAVMTYKLGQLDGVFKEYDDEGFLKQLSVYKDGKLIEQKSLGENGEPRPKGPLLFNRFPLPDIGPVHWGAAVVVFVLGMAVASFFWGGKQKRAEEHQGTAQALAEDAAASLNSESQTKISEFNVLHEDSERMYRRMVETVNSGLFLAEANGRLNYVNFFLAQTLGFSSKSELIGRNIKDILKDDEGRFWDILKEKRTTKEYRLSARTAGGQNLTLAVSANILWDEQGKVIGVEGAVSDISDQHRLQEEVVLEKKKLESILEFYEKIDTVRDMDVLGSFVVAEVAGILEAKRCSLMVQQEGTQELKMVGAQGIAEDIIAQTAVTLGETIAGEVAKDGEPVLVKNIEYDPRFQRAKLPYYLSRSFVIVPFRIHDKLAGVINVTDKHDPVNQAGSFTETDFKILRIIGARVATAMENVLLFKELNLQTVTDPLTQIFNYRLFSESLDQEIRRVRREKDDLCISMIDVDHFKTYNDTFGHVEGDELLRGFGDILKKNLRDCDIVCRYAGDEFCVVFPDTGLQGACLAAEKVRGVVERYPFKRKVTLSIGVAQYEVGMTKKELIQKADKALYRAKENGRNQVAVA